MKSILSPGSTLREVGAWTSASAMLLLLAVLMVASSGAHGTTEAPSAGSRPPDRPPEAEAPRPAALEGVGIDQRLGAALPLHLPFQDERGAAVRLGDYFGKGPVILTLNYYECPMLCTLELNGLVAALRTMSLEPGRDFGIVTLSIDPRETPVQAARKKAQYVKEYGRPGAAQGWHFLTGGPEEIAALAEAVGFRYAFDEASGQYAHAAGIAVATPDGRLSRYFYGVEFAPRDLRLGLVESSDGRIGTLADQVLLFCYHYDPKTGRYGAAALNLMRAGGVLTISALAICLVWMLRRERPPRAGEALESSHRAL